MSNASTCPRVVFPLVLLAGSSMLLIGCPPPAWSGPEAARRRITSDLPSDRIRATAILGNRIMREPEDGDVKLLIDRLEDTDAAARLYAIAALEQLAGDRMGYEPWAPLVERHRAVARWRSWFAARGKEGR